MIEGVVLTPLSRIVDERGSVLLMLKKSDPYFAGFAEWNAATAIRLPVPLLTLQHPKKNGESLAGSPFFVF